MSLLGLDTMLRHRGHFKAQVTLLNHQCTHPTFERVAFLSQGYVNVNPTPAKKKHLNEGGEGGIFCSLFVTFKDQSILELFCIIVLF